METKKPLEGKRVLVTGGTGSLGNALVRRMLGGDRGVPSRIIVFSRDEAKQHFMRLEYLQRKAATDEVIYHNPGDILEFVIGDVRDYGAVYSVLKGVDIVFHAAALKQVPSCEYFPFEAVLTNIHGANNLVRAIREHDLPVKKVVGISTDKACKPINVMGMTKALQERVLIEANRSHGSTEYCCVRYGNVIASRGSIVPLFVEQIRSGGPVTITLPEMTRFLLTLDKAVDTVFEALESGRPGETYVPKVQSAKIVDLAKAMIGDREIEVTFTGIRPGEKLHEIMVSEEECFRTTERNGYYVILPVLPELRQDAMTDLVLNEEYSSQVDNVGIDALRSMLSESEGEIADFVAGIGKHLR